MTIAMAAWLYFSYPPPPFHPYLLPLTKRLLACLLSVLSLFLSLFDFFLSLSFLYKSVYFPLPHVNMVIKRMENLPQKDINRGLF